MGLSHITTSISVFLAGLLPMSCQHKAATTKATPGTTLAATTNSNLHDLGEVALTNHYETCVQLGGGKDCILRPKMIDAKNAEITLTFESKTPAGKLHDMTVTQVTTRSGTPLQLAFGDVQLNFTPTVVSE